MKAHSSKSPSSKERDKIINRHGDDALKVFEVK